MGAARPHQGEGTTVMYSIRTTKLDRQGRRLAIMAVVTWMAAGLAGCGSGGGSAPSAGEPSDPPGGTGAAGTGTVRAKVTDVFGDPVAGASVSWLGSASTVTLRSGSDGAVQFENVPGGRARVCADHPVRGHTCGAPDSITVEKGKVLELSRQLEPGTSPVAAVLAATVNPGGISADGRSLDVTIRVAVTNARVGSSWFDDGSLTTYRTVVADCTARTGDELAQLGPRCIRAADGSDISYSFGGLKDLGIVEAIQGEPQPWAVGLLIDQSDAGLSPDLAPNEQRLFASKLFADALLPDTRLALAAFASDDPSGSLSKLPQQPVTFFPVEAPGFVTSRPEAFDVLQDLSGLVGGGAPLYDAIVAGVEFMATHTPSDLRRGLVIVSHGSDSTCGTPARCTEQRRKIVAAARAADVQLFLVGVDGDYLCNAVTEGVCDYVVGAQEPLILLAIEGGIPLVVDNSTFGGRINSSLDLVRQWLSGAMLVQNVSVRLTTDTHGAFAPGVVVTGRMGGVNPELCPLDCLQFSLPFNVTVPN